MLGSVRAALQDQAQSPATSRSSKSSSTADDDDSSDSEEGERASVLVIESNDGLSTYERQRQERVERNNQRLFELGLVPKVSAGGMKGGGRKRVPSKPRRSTATVPIRKQPARTLKAKNVATVSSLERLGDDAPNLNSMTHHQKHLCPFRCRF